MRSLLRLLPVVALALLGGAVSVWAFRPASLPEIEGLISDSRFLRSASMQGEYYRLVRVDGVGQAASYDVFLLYRRLDDETLFSLLLLFEPDSGTMEQASLLRIGPQGALTQWHFQPGAEGSPRELSARERMEFLPGLDWRFEDQASDLAGREEYELGEIRRLEGRYALQIVTRPKEAYAAESAYGENHLWLDSEGYEPLRSEFFDREGRAVKTVRFSLYRGEDPSWNAGASLQRFELIHHLHQSVNVITVRDFRIDPPLPGEWFAPGALAAWDGEDTRALYALFPGPQPLEPGPVLVP